MRQLPDARNASPVNNFTQVPNDLLRNPTITSKAKTILGLLLSNQVGWVSSLSMLQTCMKEGRDAIRSGVTELEEIGYLRIIKFKDKATGQFSGSFWAYTNIPYEFDLTSHNESLVENNLEIVDTPRPGNQDLETTTWKPNGNNIIDNNNNNKSIKNKQKAEWLELFDMFWLAYPRKKFQDKAIKEWNAIFHKTYPNLPDIETMLKAIHDQSKNWDKIKFTPYPSNWLKDKYWLEESEQPDQAPPPPKITHSIPAIVVSSLKKDIYLPVLKKRGKVEPRVKQEFLSNIFQLYEELERVQDPEVLKKEDIPNAHLMLVEYGRWLVDQDWIDIILPAFFTRKSKMWDKFYQQLCRECNIDILTGDFYGY